MAKRITKIPAYDERKTLSAAIYCRVSSNSVEQLHSLSEQASILTSFIAAHGNWIQEDTYIDIASAKDAGGRPQFERLVRDCTNGRIQVVAVKNISRFGRDTVEFLDSIRRMRDAGARVVFVEEGLDTSNVEEEIIISVYEAVVQAENESRGENIRLGMKFRAANGTLGFYRRKCYGYYNDEGGNLAIDEEKAEVVRLIYSLYLEGKSVLGIIKELENRGIPSPQGKPKWNKSRIDEILKNVKYIGDVHVLKSDTKASYLATDAHPAILPKGVFDAVQKERRRRSNVEQTTDGVKRKSTKYSSKKAK